MTSKLPFCQMSPESVTLCNNLTSSPVVPEPELPSSIFPGVNLVTKSEPRKCLISFVKLTEYRINLYVSHLFRDSKKENITGTSCKATFRVVQSIF